MRTKRYPDLAAVQAEKERLRRVRDVHRQALEGHWQRVSHDKDYRLRLTGDAVKSALGIRPGSWGSVATGLLKEKRILMPLASMALGKGMKFVGKRWFWVALGSVVPMLLRDRNVEDVFREVGVTMARVRDRILHRNGDEAPDQEAED